MTSLLTSRLSTVKTDFPTGNGLVTYRFDGAFLIDRDLRDSTGDRWYWHIRVRPTGGEPVQVRMARAGLLGRYGPAVSCGGSYEWLWPNSQVADSFSLAAPLGVTTLGLCATVPYGPRELWTFRRRLGTSVAGRFLAVSEHGRPVPLVVTSTMAPTVLVLTARHHACEAMASFVLEGAIERFVRAKASDQPAARRCDLFAVPFVDVDGVWAGDQGKARQPWDHNRDYGAEGSRYRAVAALRGALAAEERPMVGLDFHTPGLRGPLEERPYIVASGDPGDREAAAQLLDDATRTSCTTDCHEAAVLLFDNPWNSVNGSGERCFSAWLRSQQNTNAAFTIEYSNAVSAGQPVDPDRARRFGGAILSGLLSLL